MFIVTALSFITPHYEPMSLGHLVPIKPYIPINSSKLAQNMF